MKVGKLLNMVLGDTRGIHFDPCPSTAVANKGNASFVRNTMLNFLAVQDRPVSVPLSQQYEPANVYVLEKDHHYCEKPLSEQFLSNSGVTEISAELAEKIEQQTHGQSASHGTLNVACNCKRQNLVKFASHNIDWSSQKN